jgi:hypothetical protein
MTILRVDTLSGIGTNGPVFDGDFEFNSQNYVILPKGTTDNRIGLTSTSGALRYNTDSSKVELYDGSQWAEVQSSRPDLNGGARGVFGGGSITPGAGTNVMQYITISSTGNSTDFGDLVLARTGVSACSSSTRGLWAGGSSFPARVNNIDYVTIASTGNALDFGDLLDISLSSSGVSNATRGVYGGGDNGTININILQYITISATGNAIDFGDLSQGKSGTSACSSPTRGIFAGGDSPNLNVIEFITISTLGNAQDFGDLTQAKDFNQNSNISNSTRGIFAGGFAPTPSFTNVIEFITMSTLGNGTDFGDLSVAAEGVAGCSSPTRGVFTSLRTGTPFTVDNRIDYITIQTQGNSVDFGDVLNPIIGTGGCSNAHGGL